MITKFKLFEGYMDIKPGDVVFCIDKTKTLKIDGIKYGNKYRVLDVKDYLISLTYYRNRKAIRDKDTQKIKKFYVKNFMIELEWEAKNYNL